MNRSPIFPLMLGLVATVAHGQQSARIVKYHVNDIVGVHAKMRYTTLIQLPATEKILEVATGTITQALDFAAHGVGVALVPQSASRFQRHGVLFKPLTDELIRIETALFYDETRRVHR